MFPIVVVPEHTTRLMEHMGSKAKFWFQDDTTPIRRLFKQARPNTGEDWSEKIAGELCRLLGVPHVPYDLASWCGQPGVVCCMCVPPDGSLVHGNELLAERLADYPQHTRYGVTQHTLEHVLSILAEPHLAPPPDCSLEPGIQTAADVFLGYVMLDAWIGNTDRHHENWACVHTPQAPLHLAPSYDHAASLGAHDNDTNRQRRLQTHDAGYSVERYAARARSAFFASPTAPRPLTTFEAFQVAGARRPDAARAWLARLREVSFAEIERLFARLPSERISPTARDFALRLLAVNQQRLLA